MKRVLLALALSAFAPATVFAQQPPAAPGAPPAPSDQSAWRSQMMQMHQQFRAKMLDLLTPSQRTQLATLAGQLATSDSPDVNGAVSQIDASLSASQKSAVLSLAASMHSQMMANMPQHSPMQQHPNAPTPDAGRLVLDGAMAVGGPPMGGMRP